MKFWRQKLFKDYDKTIGVRSEYHQKLWSDFISAAGWKSAAGSVPGYFQDKPAGHRCIWSCNWSTAAGIIRPDQLMPLETASGMALVYEAVDFVMSRPGDLNSVKLAPMLLTFFMGDKIGNMSYWLSVVRDVLGSVRPAYPDFVCAWAPPPLEGQGRLIVATMRPGWGEIQKVLTLAGGL